MVCRFSYLSCMHKPFLLVHMAKISLTVLPRYDRMPKRNDIKTSRARIKANDSEVKASTFGHLFGN